MENRGFQYRTLFLSLLIVLGFSGLSLRLVQLQLVEQEEDSEAPKRVGRRQVLPAHRGMIVDRNDEVLARNLPVASLMVDKKHLEDERLVAEALGFDRAKRLPEWQDAEEDKRRSIIRREKRRILDELEPHEIEEKHLAYAIGVLAKPLGMSRDELRQAIKGPTLPNGKELMYLTIKKDIPEDLSDRLEELVREHHIHGFTFEKSLRRWYTSPSMATHLVGFTDQNNTGRFGVEASLDKYLTGSDGYREEKRDAYGLLLPAHAGVFNPPKSGLNVQLTLDMGIQAIVEEELDAAMKEYQAAKACVVVLDPHTGELLAMANRPHFDLNLRENVDKFGMNFALQAIYEPGSTFKIIAASGALDRKLVTPQTSIFCHNGMYINGAVKVPDHHPYGSLTVEGVLAKSSNVGAYKMALQLGHESFFEYVKKFGFGVKTGIQMSGESRGMVRDTNNIVDFSRASYGYAVSVTPLQVASAYGVLANGGKLLKPHIVRQVVADDGKVIERYDPEVIGQAIRPETAKQMRAALRKVVDPGGTATSAAVPGYPVAGKTGTAVKHNPNGRGYLNGRYTVSFAGFMPADDPAFVCVVVVDDPQTTKVSRYGGTIAAPVFGKIAARIAAQMNLQPTEPVQKTSASLAESRRP